MAAQRLASFGTAAMVAPRCVTEAIPKRLFVEAMKLPSIHELGRVNEQSPLRGSIRSAKCRRKRRRLAFDRRRGDLGSNQNVTDAQE